MRPTYLPKQKPFFTFQRQCEINKSKLCACQGSDPNTEGASYTFGCSWNVYNDACKFAKSGYAKAGLARKFKLNKESEVKKMCNFLF